jgi:hypothetical protein
MITPTKVEPTTSDANIVGVASGVWSTQDQLEAKRGGAWPDASVANPDTLIENNFSIDIWTGASAEVTINNGIDFANKGGLFWAKARSATDRHVLIDTEQGRLKYLRSDTNAATASLSDGAGLKSFNNNGVTLGASLDWVNVAYNDLTSVGWSFKKAPKFFDIVTWTGDGVDNREISHNLGSTPGMIIMKRTNATENWYVGCVTGFAHNNGWKLNTTEALSTYGYFGTTAPDASKFHVASFNGGNANGSTYVAYLFGHDTSSDGMIRCGYYDGTGDTDVNVNLGWEPQWIMVKRADDNSDNVDYQGWVIQDTMRGLTSAPQSTSNGYTALLTANHPTGEGKRGNSSNAAGESTQFLLTSTGFTASGDAIVEFNRNSSGSKYLYMAIRRPNMATITDATDVFAIDTLDATQHDSGFPVDMAIYKLTSGSNSDGHIGTRLTGGQELDTTDNGEESANSRLKWVSNTGFYDSGGANTNLYAWMWKRAKGYFDVVAYNGTGSARTIAHGLTVAPEMIWVKMRSNSDNWKVKCSSFGDNSRYLQLNDDAAIPDGSNAHWNNTAPTSTVFSVGDHSGTNENNRAYVAYLFATLAGVSKVGSATHSGSSTDVDCGFSAGARLVMLKRTDSAGDWYWWDTTRGIVSGNDPYLLLNSDAVDVTNTDFIDPLSSGFQISGDFTDGDYIFYAIA